MGNTAARHVNVTPRKRGTSQGTASSDSLVNADENQVKKPLLPEGKPIKDLQTAGVENEVCDIELVDIDKKDGNGNTPLHIAVIKNDKVKVRLFIENGASTDAQNSDGNSPFHLAIIYKASENIVEALMQRGASVKPVNKNGDTVLHLVFHPESFQYPGLRSKIFQYGMKQFKEELFVNIDNQNNEGNSLLHLAAGLSSSETYVRRLLNCGASLGVKNCKNLTPYDVAPGNSFQRHQFNVYLIKLNLLYISVDVEFPPDTSGKKERRKIQIVREALVGECLYEINKMIHKKVGGKTSLLEFIIKFHKSHHQCSDQVLKNVEKLLKHPKRMNRNFQIYSNVIESTFLYAKHRARLISEAGAVVANIWQLKMNTGSGNNGVDIPDSARELVLSFLNNKDLTNLIKSHSTV